MCQKIEKCFSCLVGCGAEKLIFLLCGALLTGPSIRTSHCAAFCCSYPTLADPDRIIHAVGSEAPFSWDLVPIGPKALSFCYLFSEEHKSGSRKLGSEAGSSRPSRLSPGDLYLLARHYVPKGPQLIFPNSVFSCRKRFKLPASERHSTVT